MKFGYLLFVLASTILFTGCYSFTGGSVPEYIKTIYVAPVADNSGYGNPKYATELQTMLTDKFSKENALTVGDIQSDAKLLVSVSSIKDETVAVKPGELESQRKITVTCNAEYYDAVNRKSFWKKTFSQYETYDIANLQTGRDNAIESSIKQISEDILLAVVSGW